MTGVLGRDLHDDADAERGQRLAVELGGAGDVAHAHADMVDHRLRSLDETASLLGALDHLALERGDGCRRVQPFGAGLGAVQDGVAAIEAERVLEVVKPLAGPLVAAVFDPAVGLKQDGRAEIAVAVPPVRRAGGRAAGAQDALVEPVELLPVLVALAPLLLRRRASRS